MNAFRATHRQPATDSSWPERGVNRNRSYRTLHCENRILKGIHTPSIVLGDTCPLPVTSQSPFATIVSASWTSSCFCSLGVMSTWGTWGPKTTSASLKSGITSDRSQVPSEQCRRTYRRVGLYGGNNLEHAIDRPGVFGGSGSGVGRCTAVPNGGDTWRPEMPC